MKRLLYALAVPAAIAAGTVLPTMNALANVGEVSEEQLNGIVPVSAGFQTVPCNPTHRTFNWSNNATTIEWNNGTDAIARIKEGDASGNTLTTYNVPALTPLYEHSRSAGATVSNMTSLPQGSFLPICD